jgi:hypothetical protein
MKGTPKPDFFSDNFDNDIPLEVLGVALWDKPGSSSYSPARCEACGKVDAVACLKGGSARSVDPTGVGVDWGHTLDAQTVMSSRMLAALRKVPGVELDTYPIGPSKKPTHWVVWPSRLLPAEPIAPQKKLLAPFPTNIAYLSHGPKCKACGRYETVTFNLQWVSVPTDVVMAGIALEKPEYQSPDWIFNAAVADAVRGFPHARLRLRGVENRPPVDSLPRVSTAKARRTRRGT